MGWLKSTIWVPYVVNGYRELSKENDVEDGIQIACCIENGIDQILTLGGGLFKYSKFVEAVKL